MSEVTRGRSFERLVNFSDGVVAVAVTVLVLPIVDIAAPDSSQTMWDVLVAHVPQLLAYAITFYVVIVLWKVHHRLFSIIDAYDGPLFALNAMWLATIAFLPWPGNMIEGVDSFAQGVGVLYFGTLALNSLIIVLMFTAMAILSVVAPSLTALAVLVFPVMSLLLPRTSAVAADTSSGSEGP